MQITVNADDLGMSRRINEQTFDLVSHGLVNSCSIAGNAPFAADAIRTAKLFQSCRFGVHLNLTEFAPMRPTAGLAPLLGGDGQFLGNVLWQRRKTAALKRAILLEWSAQIEHCIRLGMRPTHLDSHHDVHLLPDFLVLLMRLQRRYRIPMRRRNYNIDARAKTFRRRVRDGFWDAAITATGSRTADYVGGLNDFRRAVEDGWLKPLLFSGRAAVEVIVHPGNDYCSQFVEETELLRSGWLNRLRDSWTSPFQAKRPLSISLNGHSPMRRSRVAHSAAPELTGNSGVRNFSHRNATVLGVRSGSDSEFSGPPYDGETAPLRAIVPQSEAIHPPNRPISP